MICTIEGCGRRAHARGWCHRHWSRWSRHGDPLRVDPINGRPPKYGIPGYDAAHKRVVRSRGSATTYTCVRCGSAAKHWALTSAPLLFDADKGLGYSLNVDDYAPMCVPCHYRFDGKRCVQDPRSGRVLGCASARFVELVAEKHEVTGWTGATVAIGRV